MSEGTTMSNSSPTQPLPLAPPATTTLQKTQEKQPTGVSSEAQHRPTQLIEQIRQKVHEDVSDISAEKSLAETVEELEAKLIAKEYENRILAGKVRGYRTLGHMYKEIKEERDRNKSKASELETQLLKYTEKLPSEISGTHSTQKMEEERSGEYRGSRPAAEGTTRRNEPSESSELSEATPRWSFEEPLIHFSGQEGRSGSLQLLSLSSVTSLKDVDQGSLAEGACEPLIPLPADGEKTSTTPPRKVSEASSTSGSDGSFQVLSSAGSTTQNTPCSPVNIRLEFNKDSPLQEQISLAVMQAAGMKGGQSQQAPILAQISIDVVRMEKELKDKHVLCERLYDENDSQRKKIVRIEAELTKSESEQKRLLHHIQEMEHARDALSPPRSLQESWVKVDTHQKEIDSGHFMTEGGKSEEEQRLTTRIKMLEVENEEIMQMNRKQAEKFISMRTEYDHKVAALEHTLHETRQKLDEMKNNAEKRQRDIDQLLLTAKTRNEKLESEKHAALTQCDREVKHRERMERRLTAETQKSQSLEERVQSLEETLRVLQEDLETAAPSRVRTLVRSPSTTETLDSLAIMGEQDMRMLVQLLRQQVTIYKDDFDTERRDRERAQTERERLHTEVENQARELSGLRNKERELSHEINRMREENMYLQECLNQKREELAALRAHSAVAPPTSTYQPPPFVAGRSSTSHRPQQQATGYVVPSPSTVRGAGWQVSFPSGRWDCCWCTFLNPPGRSTCEMCGKPRGSHPSSSGSSFIPEQAELRLQTSPHRHLIPRLPEECDETSARGAAGREPPVHDIILNNMDQLEEDTTDGRPGYTKGIVCIK